MAIGPAAPQDAASAAEQTERIARWIDALNADTDMVLVAAAAEDEALAREVWSRAAYLVPLPADASTSQALRALLQETLNRGRDAALLTSLQNPPISGEAVRSIAAAYRTAGDEVWAVLPEAAACTQSFGPEYYPMLLGREMIELFLRHQRGSAPEEIFLAHREHIVALKSSGIAPAFPASLSKQEPSF